MRSKVLQCFKSLHRARLQVFDGDIKALTAARLRINDEFLRNKYEQDPDKIQKLIKIAEDSEKVLKKTVVQGVLKDESTIKLKVTKDTLLTDYENPGARRRTPKRKR